MIIQFIISTKYMTLTRSNIYNTRVIILLLLLLLLIIIIIKIKIETNEMGRACGAYGGG